MNNRILPGSAIARTCSAIADQILLFCIPIVVFQKTGSIRASGFAYAVEWLPRIASLLASGVVVDRASPKRVAVICDIFRSGLCLIGLVLSIFDAASSFVIYAILAGVIGIFYETSFVSFDVLLCKSASSAELPRMQSLIQGIEQLSLVVGPAAAALMFTQLGLSSLFAGASVLFITSAVVLGSLQPMQAKANIDGYNPASGSPLAQMKSGFIRIATTPELRLLALLGFCMNFALGIAISSSPGLLSQKLKLPPAYYGIMNTVAGAFSILVFTALARFRLTDRLERLSMVACMSCVAGALGLAISRSSIIFIAAFALLLAGDGAMGVVIRAMRARLVPPGELGVTTSAMMLILLAALPMSGFAITWWPLATGTLSLLTVAAGIGAVASLVCIPKVFRPQPPQLTTEKR